MTSKHSGKYSGKNSGKNSGLKIISIAAATLLVAACSKNEPETDTGMNDAPQTPVVQDENISTVNNSGDIDAQNLGGTNYFSADQSGLDQFAETDRVFFDYDSDVLTSEARAKLQLHAEWLNHHTGVDVVIEGHCDERGTRDYNLALGERRALAVKNYLIALDVASNRMSTISYGKERPEVVGSDATSWKQNRRGVLVVK